jgi:Aminoglycoside-2''-adenylyltransferase
VLARVALVVIDPDLDAWDAWRPEEVARRLTGVSAPWCVAAGWAIELFLGSERREHEDLEIAVPSHRFGELAEALAGFELFVPGGRCVTPWPERAGDHHQTWVRDPGTGRWRLDVFREPADGGTWICRRDESIRLPYAHVIEHTTDGIPYLRPEIVVLFKAKHSHLDKNALDFADTLPRLEADRRAWLADALGRVHPGHAWIGRCA